MVVLFSMHTQCLGAMDCFTKLGVQRTSSQAEIRQSYVEKVMFAHRDNRGMDIALGELQVAYKEVCQHVQRRDDITVNLLAAGLRKDMEHQNQQNTASQPEQSGDAAVDVLAAGFARQLQRQRQQNS